MSIAPSARPRSRTSHPVSKAANARAGDWRLVELLSETKHSRVFRAQPWSCSPGGPADYVVKMASERDASVTPIANALIKREAQIARRINDPHVTPVLELHDRESPGFLVMPYLDGTSVAERLQAKGPLPLAIALWVARQTVEGLSAIHGAGFLHGDIKPQNTMLSVSGHVTVTDLACARPIDVSRGEQDCLMTTIRYAAPELFRSDEAIVAASDIYSLGVTLYEMLSGEPPFLQSDVSQLVQSHLEETPAEPATATPLPPRVSRLVHRMLSKQPLRRPSLKELQRILVGLEIEWLAERVQQD